MTLHRPEDPAETARIEAEKAATREREQWAAIGPVPSHGPDFIDLLAVPPAEPAQPPTASQQNCQVPGDRGQPICVRTVAQALCQDCPDGPAEFNGQPDPEWQTLLDRAVTEQAVDVVCDAYSLGLQRGVERAQPDAAELEFAPAGLDVEQTIRHHALGHAMTWIDNLTPDDGDLWTIADHMAAYIRDGSRPA